MVEDERLSTKRKDIDRVNDEFSDFSLTSPARKIRRLDVDLPPIVEEDMAMQETESEEIEPNPVNEERAIVLFKPLLHHQPSSSGQLFVDRDLISDFKNRFFRGASRAVDINDEDETSNKCQAVVCWNPSISPSSQQPRRTLEIVELDETCDDAVMDEAAMEIEEDNRSSTGLSLPQQGQQQQEDPTYGFGLHQWQQQQQHCMVPPLPQVNTTPVTWFR